MNSLKNNFFQNYRSFGIDSSVNLSEIDYSRHSKSILKRISKFLPISLEAKILVVACGCGFEVYALQKIGYKNVVGVDISSEQINIAKKFCNNVYQSDINDFLSIKENSQYDCILSFDFIEHFSKYESIELIRKFSYSIKDSGSLILQTPNGDSPLSSSIFYGDITHDFMYTPRSLSSVLLMLGLNKLVLLECGPVVHGFKSFLRKILWISIKNLILLWNIAEMGSKGSYIYTRVFIAVAKKE